MSYLRKLSNVMLARHYRMYHSSEAIEELKRRDKLTKESEKQLLFLFAQEEDWGNNLSVKQSVEEIYEAGYCAGLKAKSKELASFQKAAKQADEILTYEHNRPVITKGMRQYLLCPWPPVTKDELEEMSAEFDREFVADTFH